MYFKNSWLARLSSWKNFFVILIFITSQSWAGGGRACSTLHPPAAHAKIIQKNKAPLKDKCVIHLWKRRLRIADGIKTKGVFTWDRDELRPVSVRIGPYIMYISFHAFTWDRSKNEFRPVAENSCSRLPHTRYFQAVPVTIPFSCKTETNLRPGP